MPEAQEPRPSQQPAMSMAGSAPSPQGEAQTPAQAQALGAQAIDPAVLAALFTDDGDSPADGEADAATGRMETLRLLARQFSFIIIPLLFAIITFFFAVLFFMARGPSSFPPIELLAIGLIALAMAILQGMMLYYSGSNSGLWFLSMLVGFVLFPPVLFFALAGAAASLIILVIMLVICGAIVWLCKALVQDGHVGIVYSFGKYQRTLPPGANFLPPWERLARVLDTRETQWTCKPQTVHMSSTEDLSLAGTIAYEIIPEEAHQVALHVNNWEQQLQDRFRASLQAIATEFKPEDFYPWQQGSAPRSPLPTNGTNASDDTNAGSPKAKTPTWSRMNTRLFQLMRDQVAPWGVQINWVTIHDVTPLPHISSMEGTKGTMGTAPANPPPSSRPGATRTAPVPPQRPQPAPAATPPPAPAVATAAATANSKQFEPIIKSYDAVRNGIITDPDTIRRIAGNFDAIARDPVVGQNFPFDAARAASNLYARAQHYEEQISVSAEFPYNDGMNDEYDDDDDDDEDGIVDDLSGQTRPDWLNQALPDDDLTAGG